jgi:hypothetical protein
MLADCVVDKMNKRLMRCAGWRSLRLKRMRIIGPDTLRIQSTTPLINCAVPIAQLTIFLRAGWPAEQKIQLCYCLSIYLTAESLPRCRQEIDSTGVPGPILTVSDNLHIGIIHPKAIESPMLRAQMYCSISDHSVITSNRLYRMTELSR